jgi:hypothetical protein
MFARKIMQLVLTMITSTFLLVWTSLELSLEVEAPLSVSESSLSIKPKGSAMVQIVL